MLKSKKFFIILILFFGIIILLSNNSYASTDFSKFSDFDYVDCDISISRDNRTLKFDKFFVPKNKEYKNFIIIYHTSYSDFSSVTSVSFYFFKDDVEFSHSTDPRNNNYVYNNSVTKYYYWYSIKNDCFDNSYPYHSGSLELLKPDVSNCLYSNFDIVIDNEVVFQKPVQYYKTLQQVLEDKKVGEIATRETTQALLIVMKKMVIVVVGLVGLLIGWLLLLKILRRS